MDFFKRLRTNAGQLLIGKNTDISKAMLVKQDIGLARVGQQTEILHEAVYPTWFYSANLGQPRNYDPQTLRSLSKSGWVQMVLNTFKREISTIEWRIVAEDEEDDTDRSKDIDIVTEKMMDINSDHQTVNDINSEVITDIGEIDAGVWNFVYSMDSYNIGEVPIYDNEGKVLDTMPGLILKPLGQRTLNKVKSVDSTSILKQVDVYKNLLRYYQWSFKRPTAGPIPFAPEEIVYMLMNKKSYDIYGFSPVQAIQQELEVLMQGTRYNKDLYKNNAVPNQLISLPGVPTPKLKKIKRKWNENFEGIPHQVGFVNFPVENVHQLAATNRDLEWLNGQQWYFKMVFANFGVSPTEAGFFENSNKSNDDGQARVTVRNALKPYMTLLEQAHTRRTITEILQREDHGLQFKYFPTDHAEEKQQFEQDMKELEANVMTINEYRTSKGKKEVEWGDVPMSKANNQPNNPNEDDPKEDPKNPNIDNLNDEQKKQLRKELYKKDFGRFLNGGRTKRNSTKRNFTK